MNVSLVLAQRPQTPSEERALADFIMKFAWASPGGVEVKTSAQFIDDVEEFKVQVAFDQAYLDPDEFTKALAKLQRRVRLMVEYNAEEDHLVNTR